MYFPLDFRDDQAAFVFSFACVVCFQERFIIGIERCQAVKISPCFSKIISHSLITFSEFPAAKSSSKLSQNSWQKSAFNFRNLRGIVLLFAAQTPFVRK
jgi:hypothetical protein